MTASRWELVQELFDAAAELPPDARADHLARRCAGDPALRAEVESLLAGAAGARESLEQAITREAARLSDEAAAIHLGKRLGPYLIVELIGAGGMGAVYLASRADDEYRRLVAIKILHGGSASASAIARLRDERQILAALDHPGIVKLLDGGRTEDGLPYLVMEHIEGAPIVRHAQGRGLSVRERVELVHRVCAAVGYAHGRLVIHRDLKPSNILVDARGEPKLLDFGIAKLLDARADREARTRTGTALFTPEYASPEQVRGEAVSPASDLYSLGAVLYELVADRPPLEATGDAPELLRRVCEVDPRPPSAVAPPGRRAELAGDLDNVVLKALHKDPARRYASIAELAGDLRRFLDGRPVIARAPTIADRVRKFLRRHRVPFALGAGAAAALSIAASLATVAIVGGRAGASPEPACGGDERAAVVWSPERKARARAAMLASPSPVASDAWRSVERRLDRYVVEWAAMRRGACEATHRTGEQSEALLDLRMRCLDHKLEELDAFVALLGTADRELVGKASRAAQAIGRLEDCADAAALTSPAPPPADPEVRGEVEALRTRLARNRALGHAARYREQLAELGELLPAVQRLGHAPLLGEALFVHGTALDRTASLDRAAEVMREAGYAAEAGADRKLAARARIELVWLVGHQLGDPRRALEYAREAEARIRGLGGDPALEAQLASNLDAVLGDLGRSAEALAQARRALELREVAFGPDDVQTAIARVNVAIGLQRMGRPEESLALYRRALETYRRELGEHHPLHAHTLFNLADNERELGRHADARRHATAARDLLIAVLGGEHTLVASADHVLGLLGLAERRLPEAEQHARRALALGSRLRGPDHARVAHYTLTLAAIRHERGDPAQALELARRALAVLEQREDRMGAARARIRIGTALAALGDRAGARAALDAALATTEAAPADDPTALAAARFALARLLVDEPATAARARELAARAVAGADASLRAEIAAWQAAHPSPRFFDRRVVNPDRRARLHPSP